MELRLGSTRLSVTEKPDPADWGCLGGSSNPLFIQAEKARRTGLIPNVVLLPWTHIKGAH